MKANKTHQIIYWVATGLIFLFEGVMPALTSHTQIAVEGIRHLGYPDYFRTLLTVFKVIGALALIIPAVKGRYKEWAYAGFGITMISACVSHIAVDGPSGQSFFPLIIFAILVTSYIYYNKINGDIERAALNSQ
ncbi:MAG TPA: DoxX family protein [Bacteroidia bacterium]|nr:DoxX family protein [Bacteroidia bacterium]